MHRKVVLGPAALRWRPPAAVVKQGPASYRVLRLKRDPMLWQICKALNCYKPTIYSAFNTWSSGPGQSCLALPREVKRPQNPKHEIRNSKQCLMIQIQMIQTIGVSAQGCFCFCHSVI